MHVMYSYINYPCICQQAAMSYRKHITGTSRPSREESCRFSFLPLLTFRLAEYLASPNVPPSHFHASKQPKEKKMEVTWSLLLATLWEPWYLMLVTLTFVPATLLSMVRTGHFAALASWRAFQDAWFADVWAVLGPQFAEGSAPVVKALLSRASGVVLDIGPGAGNWVHLYPNASLDGKKRGGAGPGGGPSGAGAVTKIYGVEPNLEQHASLRRKVKEAGLEGVYEIVGAGAEKLGGLGLGIGKGTVDTVVTKQVLCSVPGPESLVRELYGYLKPGGIWIMYEHVKTKEKGWVEWYQGMSCVC
jgi:hypothetical protein